MNGVRVILAAFCFLTIFLVGGTSNMGLDATKVVCCTFLAATLIICATIDPKDKS